MTLNHCSICQSQLSQKWSGDRWTSMHSCTTTAYVHNHPHHKLRRAWSDPGVCCSTATLAVDSREECRATKNISSADDSIIVSIDSDTDLLDDLRQTAQGQASIVEDNPRKSWSEVNENLEDNDSLFGREELVHLDDYYYEDEESKSQILPFKNCSLRLHGLLLLIFIYAAGYLAYTFVAPSSKRKCHRPPSTVSPVIP